MLQSDFTQQHVFIVGDGTLFDESITQLLTHETDWLVLHAIFSDNPAFLNTVNVDWPDVILVNESSSLDTAQVLDLVSSHPIVMGLPIVVARLYNNVIDVYEEPTFVAGKLSCTPHRIIARTRDDLLNALRRKHNVQ